MDAKILVVDDDVHTLDVLVELLSSLGVETLPISDSREAATAIHRETFDGIFLDLMMPNVDGYELARQVRQSSRNRRTPIVIITGNMDKQTMTRAFKAGGTFFLQKPVDKSQLKHLLNSARGVMLAERRRCSRISLHTEVMYTSGPLKMSGMSYSLATDGIVFQAVSPLEPGATVSLSFCLQEPDPSIELVGSVAEFNEEMRARIRFTQVSGENQQRIKDFIARHLDTS